MRPLTSTKLFCSREIAQSLVMHGIYPVANFYYYQAGPEVWVVSQEPTSTPAFTMEELAVMIGGDIAKPDLPSKKEWTKNRDMLQYLVYLPNKVLSMRGAEAMAFTLEFLLLNDEVKPTDCNERYAKYFL